MLLKVAPGAEGLFEAADLGAADLEAAGLAAGLEPGGGSCSSVSPMERQKVLGRNSGSRKH
jgi:hypothetical protein